MAKGFLTGYKTYNTSDGFGSPSEWTKAFRHRMGKAEANTLLGKQSESAYDILGIAETATKAEIKKAYRSRMMEWHPDKNPHRTALAVQKSLLIIAAYEKLND